MGLVFLNVKFTSELILYKSYEYCTGEIAKIWLSLCHDSGIYGQGVYL